eukprot:TRINITY_DN3969_c0_g2_i1.p1 TRINITY_DN3969_c0_g2~~TRINITY_DN3969_c0_g2_i1.p1  ORF type:complete len:237 (+),score=18.42 TRINITY_DN3969_c0_g2_i1:40-711(+)
MTTVDDVTTDVVFMISLVLVLIILMVLGIRKLIEHLVPGQAAGGEGREPYGGDETSGGKIGLAESELPSIPDVREDEWADPQESENQGLECPICLDKIDFPSKYRPSTPARKPGAILIKCGHSLCVYCSRYLATDSRCPICRGFAVSCVAHSSIKPPLDSSLGAVHTLAYPCLHLFPHQEDMPPDCPVCKNPIQSFVNKIRLGETDACRQNDVGINVVPEEEV